MNRRRIFSTLLVMSAIFLLAFPAMCSAAQKPITITWWINPWRITTPDLPANKAPEAEDFPRWISQKFMKEHPGVTVKFEVVTNAGYEQKLAAAIAAGNPPDISRPVGDLNQWVKWGIVEPIDQYLTADDLKDFLPYTLAEGAINGKHYIWPWNNSDSGKGSALLANTARYNSRGLAIPKDVSAKYWTVTQFLDAMKKLTWDANGDGITDYYGIAMTAKSDIAINLAWLFIYGGQFVDMNKQTFTLNGSKEQEAMQFMLDLVYKYKVSPTGAEGLGIYDVISMFHNGKVATGYGGPYEINRISRYALEGTIKEFATRLLPNPHIPAVGPVAYLTTSGFVVFNQKDAEKEKMVMEFAKELTSTETLTMLESLYYLSARKSANKLMYKSSPQIANEIDNYMEFISYGKPFTGPPTLALGDATKYLQSMWEALFSRSKTPADAAAEFVKNANRIVFKK